MCKLGLKDSGAGVGQGLARAMKGEESADTWEGQSVSTS